jgi:hypothetical protein
MTPTGALSVVETPQAIAVRGDGFSLVIDRGSGHITSWQAAGRDLIKAGPALNLWRAPTENDLNTWGEERAAIHWREAGLHILAERPESVQVTSRDEAAVRVEVKSVSLPDPARGEDLPEKVKAFTGQAGMLINGLLDEDAFKAICDQLGVDYASLPGAWRAAKAPTMARRLAEQNRAGDLIRVLYRALEAAWGASLPQPIRDNLGLFANLPAEQVQAALAPQHTARVDATYRYTIYASGDVVVDVHADPKVDVRQLPRIGLQLTVPGGFEHFTWYGRGPHESYADRKESARIGVYSGSVDDQYVPYILPEENGNKTEVRWVALTDDEGAGFLAVGMPELNVSAHHYTTADLTAAKHTFELVRRDDTTLNLDYAQSGLGNGSCGPGVLPKYRLEPAPVDFRLRLRPLAPGDSPVALSKQVLA